MIYFGDVQVGRISRRAGVPAAAPQWGWSCGFYPGMKPGDQQSGVAETFDEARAAFQRTWGEVAPKLTDADYEAWRQQRDWIVWKDRMHDLALPLPTQRPEGVARCFCGEVVTNPTLEIHVRTAHRLTAA